MPARPGTPSSLSALTRLAHLGVPVVEPPLHALQRTPDPGVR
jgi:hypothetical protein